jgi:uroporphyrinogen-III synthase
VVACIGPVTAETAERCGLTVDVIAPVHTIDGLVDALTAALAGRERPPPGPPAPRPEGS